MTDHRIEKLTAAHAVGGFECGKQPLDRFLTRNALQNQQASASTTYVALANSEVIGFYTLVVGSVEHDTAQATAPRITKGLAKYPVPVIVLARMAVSTTWHGKGIGKALLRDAVLRILQAAEIVGVRAMLVHAKDDEARTFYEKFDFASSPTDPLHMMALIKDLRSLVSPGI